MKLRNFIRRIDSSSECKINVPGVGETEDIQLIEECKWYIENKDRIIDWFYIHMNMDRHAVAEVVIYLKPEDVKLELEDLDAGYM